MDPVSARTVEQEKRPPSPERKAGILVWLDPYWQKGWDTREAAEPQSRKVGLPKRRIDSID